MKGSNGKRLRAEERLAILHMLVEGNSIRSVERLTGVHRDTVMRASVKAGQQCRAFLDRTMRELRLDHLQLDEQWTYVGKKAARVPVEERRERYDVGDQWLFLAIDQTTKLVPTFAIGKRTGDNARRFAMDLASRIAWPKPHASDPHGYYRPEAKPVVQVSTDRWAAYPESIDLAFGRRAMYGQLRKDYRNRQIPGNYVPGEMVAADRRVVFGDFDPETICTSHSSARTPTRARSCGASLA